MRHALLQFQSFQLSGIPLYTTGLPIDQSQLESNERVRYQVLACFCPSSLVI